MKIKVLCFACLVFLLAAYPATQLVSAAPANETFSATPVAPHPLGDPQELETFVDGVMTKQLEEQHIARAVVVIVKDGEVILSKGYGYANMNEKIPVDAESTIFRPGSVTKLFTWTAVMQLVEQGKINLTADINTYLTDFKIPTKDSRPITMLDLISHTAGFGETGVEDATYNADELTSLDVYLKRYMPPSSTRPVKSRPIPTTVRPWPVTLWKKFRMNHMTSTSKTTS